MIQTVLELDKTYGLTSMPGSGSVPWVTQNYKEFGIDDLSVAGLAKSLSAMANAPLSTQLNYMTKKIGFVLPS